VAEGSGENIFIIRNGGLYTPPSSGSILPGITRHTIFTIAKELGLKIEKHLIPRESLYIADEIFMTGTAAEITPVTKVDNISIGSGKRGPITQKIQDAFFDVLTGKKEDKNGFLHFV
jgi:branched-chain amino acid aminotransferase